MLSYMQMNKFQLANMCTDPGGRARKLAGHTDPKQHQCQYHLMVPTDTHRNARTRPPKPRLIAKWPPATARAATHHFKRTGGRRTTVHATAPPTRKRAAPQGAPQRRQPRRAPPRKNGTPKRTRDRGRDPQGGASPAQGSNERGAVAGNHHLIDSHPHAWRRVAAPQFGRQACAGSACNMV